MLTCQVRSQAETICMGHSAGKESNKKRMNIDQSDHQIFLKG
jgi:hypothetical protein